MCENGTAATTACCEMKRLHVLLAGTGQGMDKGLSAGDCPRGKDAGTWTDEAERHAAAYAERHQPVRDGRI